MEIDGLTYRNVCFHYSGNAEVLKDFNLEVKSGEITCLLGPSGCGKTTLLHLTGGLLKPNSGSITGIRENSISIIFQETRILPWMTVLENVMFPLKSYMNKDQARQLAIKFIEMMNLQDQMHTYPGQLSGGMKQRVAISRAFAFPSSLILMDEAFKGLDAVLKKHILENFIEIWKSNPRTVVFVTHDIEEALLLGDEIIVLDGAPLVVSKRLNQKSGSSQELRDEILKSLS